MIINIETISPIKKKSDLLCCFVTEDGVKPLGLPKIPTLLENEIKQELKSNEGKFGKISVISTLGQIIPKKILLVGIGDASKINQDTFRFVTGKITRKANELKISEISITVPKSILTIESVTTQIIEGLKLSSYSFDKYKNKNEIGLQKISLIFENSNKNSDILKRSQIISDAVNYARDIANLPPNDCAPSTLSSIANILARKNRMRCKIISKSELKTKGFGGIYAVGKGSKNEPKLIVIEYNGSKNKKQIVLVGKAVTFDTGGISLKPGDKMDEMKFDKCGGCTVLGIMKAVSELKLPVNVVGIIPSVENMPGGESFRPGDIIKLYNGKTAEILNTDAEGRLILADAIAYGEKNYNPSEIIDFATLTGACIIALGTNVAGVVSNDDAFVEKIKISSENTSEEIWQLPLNDDYMDMIKSDVADMKNVGLGRTAGTIAAAAFLRKAIEKTPWVHFDIAGVAWTQLGTKEKPYNPKGATGFGIRLLVDYLSRN